MKKKYFSAKASLFSSYRVFFCGILILILAVALKISLLSSSNVGFELTSEDNSVGVYQPIDRLSGLSCTRASEQITRELELELVFPKSLLEPRKEVADITCSNLYQTSIIMRGFYRHHYASWIQSTSSNIWTYLFNAFTDQYGIAGTALAQILVNVTHTSALIPRQVAILQILSSLAVIPFFALATLSVSANRKSASIASGIAFLSVSIYVIGLNSAQLALSPGFSPIRYMPLACLVGVFASTILQEKSNNVHTRFSAMSAAILLSAALNSFAYNLLVLISLLPYLLTILFGLTRHSIRIPGFCPTHLYLSKRAISSHIIGIFILFAVLLLQYIAFKINTADHPTTSMLASAVEGRFNKVQFAAWVAMFATFYISLLPIKISNWRSLQNSSEKLFPWALKIITLLLLSLSASLYGFWYWGSPNHMLSLFVANSLVIGAIIASNYPVHIDLTWIRTCWVKLFGGSGNKGHSKSFYYRRMIGLMGLSNKTVPAHERKSKILQGISLMRILDLAYPPLLALTIVVIALLPFLRSIKKGILESIQYPKAEPSLNTKCVFPHSSKRPSPEITDYYGCTTFSPMADEIGLILHSNKGSHVSAIVSSAVLTYDLKLFKFSVIGWPDIIHQSLSSDWISAQQRYLKSIDDASRSNMRLKMGAKYSDAYLTLMSDAFSEAARLNAGKTLPANFRSNLVKNTIVVVESPDSLLRSIIRLTWLRSHRGAFEVDDGQAHEIDLKIIRELNRLWLSRVLSNNSRKVDCHYAYHCTYYL